MDKATKVGLITFTVFMAEAIIHYNIGVRKDNPEKNILGMPPMTDFVKLAVVVGIFSVVNGIFVNKFTS